MMSPSQIYNISYYEPNHKEDYYSKESEPQGKWIGRGSKCLKLGRFVEQDDYRKIFNGFDQQGNPLSGGAGKNHRHGWDLTFSAPKSVSILWAGESEEMQHKIENAQQQAVEEAFNFIQDKVARTRRGHDGLVHEEIVGLIGATFQHCSSRALDPQIHTHCLVANIAPRTDLSWGTLESKYFYFWQKAIGAIYRSSLSRYLQELGYEIEEVAEREHFEVQGIDNKISEHFSKRKKAILAEMKSLGVEKAASKAGDFIALNTRDKKQNIGRSELLETWKTELSSLEYSSEYFSSLRNKTSACVAEPLPLQHILAELVAKNSVFRLEDIYAVVAKEAQYRYVPYNCIEDTVSELLNSTELVLLENHRTNENLYTTRSMLQAERDLISIATRLNAKQTYRLNNDDIANAIETQEGCLGFKLSEEQTDAIHAVCQSGLDIVQGKAGAGKSIAMSSMRLAYERSNIKVRGATVSRKASLQLENDTGIKSSTITSLLGELQRTPSKFADTVILIDEAGQIGSLDLLKLMRLVDTVNAKLVLLGEQEQTDAIEHGGSLRYLSDKFGCKRLNTIRRQNAAWAREAVNQLRNGKAKVALKEFHSRGLLNIEVNKEAAQIKLVDKWQSYVESNPTKESMIMTQSWREAISISELIRERYKEKGVLGSEDFTVECVISNRAVPFNFAKGERVRFTKNDYARNFTNGALGTVTDIERVNDDIYFSIVLDTGDKTRFKKSEYSDEHGRLYLAQAYVSTVYSSQGATIDGDTFLLYNSRMDRALSYVAGSRHKDKCHWFVNREEVESLASDRTNALQEEQIMSLMAKNMDIDRKNSLAIEYLEAQEAEHLSTNFVTSEMAR
jgi:conjugative relaxase-like TrwC/TraI family protein